MSQPSNARLHVASLSVPLRWGDMDSLGHLNNANYFRCFEEGRLTWLSGLVEILDTPPGDGFVLASVCATFRRQVRWPNTVTIDTYVTSVGRSSLTLYQEMVSAGGPGLIYADSESRLVWAEIAAGQSRPIPEALRRLLGAPALGVELPA